MSKTALITGASSGIGMELAKLFARDKYDLVLVARREEPLIKLSKSLVSKHGIKAEVITCDLTQSNSPGKLLKEIEERGINIDVLVNNAGFGARGLFWQLDIKTELDQIHVNVRALTELTRRLLPKMIEKGSGGIINVGSIAGYQPGPLMAVYYATKAYVLSFSEALANELQGTGVVATCVCPGPTNTEFSERAGVQASPLFSLMLVMNAPRVAQLAYEGFNAGKQVVITGLHNQAIVFAGKFAPRSLSLVIARRLND